MEDAQWTLQLDMRLILGVFIGIKAGHWLKRYRGEGGGKPKISYKKQKKVSTPVQSTHVVVPCRQHRRWKGRYVSGGEDGCVVLAPKTQTKKGKKRQKNKTKKGMRQRQSSLLPNLNSLGIEKPFQRGGESPQREREDSTEEERGRRYSSSLLP